MPTVEWTGPALRDLQNAGEYIAQHDPAAATRMAERIREAVEYLPEQPNLGRPGRVGGTRELVVSGSPFIVIYWSRGGVIQILRLLHHARRWP
ncbi:MAG: type II toxin-antitoxin system RelE/ParE family toxin [Thermodesulfobacteriota bacterium]